MKPHANDMGWFFNQSTHNFGYLQVIEDEKGKKKGGLFWLSTGIEDEKGKKKGSLLSGVRSTND